MFLLCLQQSLPSLLEVYLLLLQLNIITIAVCLHFEKKSVVCNGVTPLCHRLSWLHCFPPYSVLVTCLFSVCLLLFYFFWGGQSKQQKKKQIRKHPPVPRPLNLTLENSVRCASVLKDQPPSVERHRCKVGRNPHTDALFMIDQQLHFISSHQTQSIL